MGTPEVTQEHAMNRLSTTRTRSRIRPRTPVLTGAAIGLLAGAAVYGAVASSSATALGPAPIKPVLVSAAIPRAPLAAPCAKGQKLEHGACIVHIVHIVHTGVVPAAGSSYGSGSGSGGLALSGNRSTKAAEHEGAGESANEAAEHESASDAAHEAAEHAKEAAGNHG